MAVLAMFLFNEQLRFSVKAIRKVYTFNGRTLKTISESKVKIDWIKSEANRLEITFKDIIECPCKVSIDCEVIESTPCCTQLTTPLKVTEVR